MSTEVRDILHFPPDELHALFADVYSSSEGMSERLEEKYADPVSLHNDLIDLCNTPGAVALAIEKANRPVAYLTIRPRRQSRLRHTADLNMGVAKAGRGQGLGEVLLTAGLAQATASPVLEIVYLMVRTDNIPAIALYRKMGFETLAILERDTKIDAAYFDGMLMRRFVDT